MKNDIGKGIVIHFILWEDKKASGDNSNGTFFMQINSLSNREMGFKTNVSALKYCT